MHQNDLMHNGFYNIFSFPLVFLSSALELPSSKGFCGKIATSCGNLLCKIILHDDVNFLEYRLA